MSHDRRRNALPANGIERNDKKKKLPWLPLLRTTVALGIVTAVSYRILVDLRQLDPSQLSLRWPWLMASGGAYLLGLMPSACFWYWLLRRSGTATTFTAALRAYFLSHLGKYVPGKAVALLLRGSELRASGPKMTAALVTALHEVMTTMASGLGVAILLFLWFPPPILLWTGSPWMMLLALVIGLVCVPYFVKLFNLVIARVMRRWTENSGRPLPELPSHVLVAGLIMTAGGWLLLGFSFWALLQGTLVETPAFSLVLWLRCTAAVAFAYVIGFLVVVVPGGLGVREWLLLELIRPLLAGSANLAAAVVLVLRLVWTLSEVAIGVPLYLWQGGHPEPPGEPR